MTRHVASIEMCDRNQAGQQTIVQPTPTRFGLSFALWPIARRPATPEVSRCLKTFTGEDLTVALCKSRRQAKRQKLGMRRETARCDLLVHSCCVGQRGIDVCQRWVRRNKQPDFTVEFHDIRVPKQGPETGKGLFRLQVNLLGRKWLMEAQGKIRNCVQQWFCFPEHNRQSSTHGHPPHYSQLDIFALMAVSFFNLLLEASERQCRRAGSSPSTQCAEILPKAGIFAAAKELLTENRADPHDQYENRQRDQRKAHIRFAEFPHVNDPGPLRRHFNFGYPLAGDKGVLEFHSSGAGASLGPATTNSTSLHRRNRKRRPLDERTRRH